MYFNFQNEFQNATSEEVKKNLCWQVLMFLHNKSLLPFVDDTLKCIRDNLEKEE
jgi:uncharacterized membrane protein